MIAASELYPEIPTVMHQDHGNAPDTCISAIRMGFTSVMMDGSLEGDEDPLSVVRGALINGTMSAANPFHLIGTPLFRGALTSAYSNFGHQAFATVLRRWAEGH